MTLVLPFPGTEEHLEVRRMAARIGVEIWRRAARMLRQCLPDTAAEDVEEDLEPLCPEVLRRVGPPHTVEAELFF